MKTALVTGVAGQDGSYLAELLLEKGYAVHGVMRLAGSSGMDRLAGFKKNLRLHAIDLTGADATKTLVAEVRPNEIYNLASPSFVPRSWDHPIETAEFSALGVVHLLEAIRHTDPSIRFFQASSSEMFAGTDRSPQNESTAPRPMNPYATAKVYAHQMVGCYRRQYSMFVCSGIFYNHGSPRRDPLFLSRKVTRAVAEVKAGRLDALLLGNLEAQRDWGYAKDYMEAAWRMLQSPIPDDYVIATGVAHSVRQLVEIAFSRAGLDYRRYVKEDPAFWRPLEPTILVGDIEKIRSEIGWQPPTSFKQLIELMVDAELAAESLNV